MSSMALSIASNTIISTLARGLGSVISLVIIGLISGYLGPTSYGSYATALAFVYLFNYLGDLGLYSVVVRDLSKPGVNAKKLVSNAFTLRLVALVVFVGIAPIVALGIPYESEVRSAILIMTLFYVFSSLSQVFMGVFQRYLRTDRAAIADIAGRLIQLGLVLLFIKAHGWVSAMAWTLSLAALGSFFITAYFARKFVPFTLAWDFKEWLAILKESWPIGLAIIFTVVYFKMDTIILSLYHPGYDVGIYNLGYQFLQALIFFPAMFAGLVMPFLSRHGIGERASFRAILQRTLNLFLAFTLPLGVVLITRGADIIHLIDYRGQFGDSVAVLEILALAIMAIYLGNLFSNALIALHRQRSLIWIYGLGAAVNVALNFYVIPRFAYIGASWTTVATEGLVTVLMVIMVARFTAGRLTWGRLLPVAAASIVLAIELVGTARVNLFLAAGAGAVAYLAVLWALGGLSKDDLLFIGQQEVL